MLEGKSGLSEFCVRFSLRLLNISPLVLFFVFVLVFNWLHTLGIERQIRGKAERVEEAEERESTQIREFMSRLQDSCFPSFFLSF